MSDAPCISVEALQTKIGEEVGISPWYLVDQKRISAFADVTEDHQFIHVDGDRTRAETEFEGTIAHGFLTLSLLSSMYKACLPPIEGSVMSLNYGLNKLRFLAPVPEGARVCGRFTLLSCVPREPKKAAEASAEATTLGLTLALTWKVSVEIEDAAKPALVCELVFLDVIK